MRLKVNWDLDFITEENFKKHVEETILKYESNLQPFDLKRLNKNVLDPIKLIFDKHVYRMDWEEIIKNEIMRQKDKTNNNDVGYFQQKIFKYMKNCTVPETYWDVIVRSDNGFWIDGNTKVSTIYAEVKNKHNTMNSASGQNTYIKMQNQILEDDDCACCLVQAITKSSHNKIWQATVNRKKISHKHIRKVSMDCFYEIVTGDPKAFYKMCMVLPQVIDEVIEESKIINLEEDTAYAELSKLAESKNVSIAYALYLLGFGNYMGF